MWAGGIRKQGSSGTTGIRVTEESLEAAGDYPRILGQIGSHEYTLLGSYRTFLNSSLGSGSSTETIRSNSLLRGAWFDDQAEPSADRVQFSLQGLTEWIVDNGITESWTFRDPQMSRLEEYEVHARLLPNRRVTLGGGRSLYLFHRTGLEGDRINERGVSQKFRLELREPKKSGLHHLLQQVGMVQHLVSLGTGRSAGLLDVDVHHPAVTYGPPSNPKAFREPIEYIAEWSARDRSDKPISQSDMHFTLRDLGGFQIFKRWIPLASTNQDQLNQVMSTRYRNALVTDKLLNRVAAFEEWHKIATGDRKRSTTLAIRLETSAQALGAAFTDLVGGEAHDWAHLVKRERHNVAHGLGQSGFEGAHTLFLADSVYYLFVFALLQQLQAPAAVFDRMLCQGEYRLLQRRMSSLVP